MTKVVYNGCYGGFGLSDEAVELYLELSGKNYRSEKGQFASLCGNTYYVDEEYFSASDIERNDPVLVEVVERLGEKANTQFSSLQIEDVAEGSLYRIDEYDGYESVMTQSDYDWKVA